jgi:fatty-acyl-CoA synthase
VSLFNVEGKPGALGRIPSFLKHRVPVALVRFAIDSEEPVRDAQGHCIRCETNETGEAIGKIRTGALSIGGRFEGYVSPEASEKKVLRNVFEPGDAWFRTGDLMREDDEGYFYFVDRIGDTFRWKGENVSTTEVAEAICAFPGVEDANVYGVPIPGTDGRAGMATVVTRGELDLGAFRAHLMNRLPPYARPLFLRIRSDIELTATFKHTKNEVVRQGYDPSVTADAVYFDDREQEGFVPLDKPLYDRIQTGQVRP